ncbi:MAG: glycosyltransferase family 39 protein [Deltaproteobacteria bacterium]|nr:glycosyltransferase family 39 protein [Deltaproteobacteria bacterium]
MRSEDRVPAILRDPIVWGNLLLRAMLFALAAGAWHWHSGDSGHYLLSAEQVCRGEWGGEPIRVPLYAWYLCLSSFGAVARGAGELGGSGVVLPLLGQTLLLFACGIVLYRRFGRAIAACWLFDPVLLVYGSFVMTDAFFAVFVLAMALTVSRALEARALPRIRARTLYFFGAALGAAILTRPVGIPLGVLSAAVLGILALRGRFKAREIAVTALIVAALLAPRLYWNQTRHGRPFIAEQGSDWIKTVAGAVEYHGTGLTFHEAEEKWMREHPARPVAEAYASIFARFPAWAWLTSKGMARVLVGHVNVEWTYLFTGRTVLGPGWFKVGEGGEGSPVSGVWLVPWLFGIALVAGYYAWLYLRAARSALPALKMDRGFAAFAAWSLLSAAFLAFAPQVFGDARFRAPIVPIVLVLWGAALEHIRKARI